VTADTSHDVFFT